MAAHEHLSRPQFKKYIPQPVRPDSWMERESTQEIGETYEGARHRVRSALASGYDIPKLESFRYQGAGKHGYYEHQALITQGAIEEHHEAVDALAARGIDVGAPDYWDDATRASIGHSLQGRRKEVDEQYFRRRPLRWESKS